MRYELKREVYNELLFCFFDILAFSGLSLGILGAVQWEAVPEHLARELCRSWLPLVERPGWADPDWRNGTRLGREGLAI